MALIGYTHLLTANHKLEEMEYSAIVPPKCIGSGFSY